MKRPHVHVSVENIDDSIRFYSGMFGAAPTVAKPDYAKWQLDDPRMNFAISQRGAPVGLDHLGIQVETGDELAQMQRRLDALQPGVEKEADTACCYARSDKYWLTDPSGIAWETFHTLDTIPTFGASKTAGAEAAAPAAMTSTAKSPVQAACCAPAAAERKSTRCC
ncbi:MAG: ArsI/CadI family heavy metal resistance metalloenzyme [Burkholderiaceae bacterium]